MFRRMRAYHRFSANIAAIIAAAASFAIIISITVNARLRPLIAEMALYSVSGEIMSGVNAKLSELLSDEHITYDDLVTLKTDSSGNISALTTNTAKMTYLQNNVGLKAIEDVAATTVTTLYIPFGSIFEETALAGIGPKIPVKILSMTNTSAVVENEFSSEGINQTRHRIVLKISVDIDIMIPHRKLSTTVVTDITAAETVIVGRVPDTMLNFSEK